jgi:hypothetical protein
LPLLLLLLLLLMLLLLLLIAAAAEDDRFFLLLLWLYVFNVFSSLRLLCPLHAAAVRPLGPGF